MILVCEILCNRVYPFSNLILVPHFLMCILWIFAMSILLATLCVGGGISKTLYWWSFLQGKASLLASSVKLSCKLISLGSVCIWRFKGRNNNLTCADDTTLMSESKEELKRLLMRMKEESEKASLQLSIQKTNFMASGPSTSRQIEGEKVGNSDRFYFLGLQNHCWRWLQPWN